MFLKNLLSKKQDSLPTSEPSEFEALKKDYQKFTSDINYLNSSWDKYIVSSLQSDFEFYKTWISENSVKEDSDNKFWTICEIKSDRFEILKKGERWSRIRLYVHFSFDESTFKFSLKSVDGYSDIKLKITKELTDIIAKYYLTTLVEGKKKEHKSSQKRFDEMVNIVGPDLVRDARIEDILKNL